MRSIQLITKLKRRLKIMHKTLENRFEKSLNEKQAIEAIEIILTYDKRLHFGAYYIKRIKDDYLVAYDTLDYELFKMKIDKNAFSFLHTGLPVEIDDFLDYCEELKRKQ